MALTDAVIKNSKPKNKPYTLKDIKGLSLFIRDTGTKVWHFRYQLNGQRKRISLGQYPLLSLKDARQQCEEVRMRVQQGLAPNEYYVQETEYSTSPTFAIFAEHWKQFKLKKLGLDKVDSRQSTRVQIERYLRKDLLPGLGYLPLDTIATVDILNVLPRIEKRGSLSIAEKCRGWLNELFRHAIAEGLLTTNPVSDLDILALPQNPTRHNPYLKISELPELLSALRHYPGAIQTRLGIQLLLLTGVRTGELREATPEQFDLINGLWNVPAENVKQLKRQVRTANDEIPPFVVPLSRQVVAVVEQLLDLRYPWQPYLLSHRTKPTEIISENTLNCGLKRMGYHGRLTEHGIRATISTALNKLGYPKEWIEAQLSHSDKDQVRAAYNHAQYVEQRRRMMQEWADRLDEWEHKQPDVV